MTACIGGVRWIVHTTQSPVSAATSQSSKREAAAASARLADGRVATAPPSGVWNPHAEDMRTGTEIKAVSRHLTPTLESEEGRLGDLRPFIVARVRLSITPTWLR